jgi:hypothetical protein
MSKFEPMFGYPTLPENLCDYPVVLCSSDIVAIIGINPKCGYILHRVDGAKTESFYITECHFSSDLNIPFDVPDWAVLAIGKQPEPHNWELEEEYRKRIKKIKKTIPWLE